MDYQAEAQLTKSSSFHGELVNIYNFKAVLYTAIMELNNLDLIKKSMFYGKLNDKIKPYYEDNDCSSIIDNLGTTDSRAIDIIHSILGKATEAGELLEALYASLFENKPFDTVNFKEEIGDGQWYDAIGLEAVGSSFAEVQATNIEKLRKRFPNRFTEYDANNRDLFAEREILEKPANIVEYNEIGKENTQYLQVK